MKTRGSRKMRGRGIGNVMRKVNRFLKRTKLLSRLGTAYGNTPLPYSKYAGLAGKAASALGYGRKRRTYRRRTGGALRLAGQGSSIVSRGGALRLAGQGSSIVSRGGSVYVGKGRTISGKFVSKVVKKPRSRRMKQLPMHY